MKNIIRLGDYVKRYYYHGLGDFYPKVTLDMVLEIISSGGIKTRNEVYNYDDDKMAHICLYKKNDEYDYTKQNALINSARGGWIDHCVFFIISPDIKAEKTPVTNVNHDVLTTNLVDEWRTNENIPLEKIVGIAFPFDSIEELKEMMPKDFDKDYYDKYGKILQFALDKNWIIENSDLPDLCDVLDDSLNLVNRKK